MAPHMADGNGFENSILYLMARSRDDAYRGNTLLLTELIMLGVTMLIVGLRIYTRTFILGAVHSDDWWILLATGCLIALTAVHGVGVKHGIGRHTDTLSKEDSDIALTMSYIGNLLYVTSLGCLKISLLFFLARIFPTITLRRVVRGVLIFVLCFTVTNIFLFAFQCDTPEYYFTKIKGGVHKEGGGICLEPQAVYYPMAAVNIFTDVVIWLLPVPPVLKARLSRREKLGLLWVFILGGVSVGASIVRPFNLRDIMEDGDPTWSMVNVSVWAAIEISVGIMCASIPAIKPLILRVAPRLLISTNDNSNGAPTYSNRRGGATEMSGRDFALHSIKVTQDVQFEVEDEMGERRSMRRFGPQEPVVERAFEGYDKRTLGGSKSDEYLVESSTESLRLPKQKNGK